MEAHGLKWHSKAMKRIHGFSSSFWYLRGPWKNLGEENMLLMAPVNESDQP